MFLNRHIQKLYQCPLGSTGSSFLAGGRRYKIVSLSRKTRPQNLVVYGSCISVYESSFRSCVSVRWKAQDHLLSGSFLAGGREYKIVSLSEEKEATELSNFTEVVFSVYESSYRSCISGRWEARDPLLLGSSLAGGREYKIVSLSEEKEAT